MNISYQTTSLLFLESQKYHRLFAWSGNLDHHSCKVFMTEKFGKLVPEFSKSFQYAGPAFLDHYQIHREKSGEWVSPEPIKESGTLIVWIGGRDGNITIFYHINVEKNSENPLMKGTVISFYQEPRMAHPILLLLEHREQDVANHESNISFRSFLHTQVGDPLIYENPILDMICLLKTIDQDSFGRRVLHSGKDLHFTNEEYSNSTSHDIDILQPPGQSYTIPTTIYLQEPLKGLCDN